MASLEGNADFEVFAVWLEESLTELRTFSSHTKDEVVLRWQQGASQVLDDLVSKIRSARQTQYSKKK